MAFTLTDLASELGIDVSTLQGKPDVVAKWNTHLTEVDSRYSQATAAQQAAETKLAQVQEEQRVIDASIANFGMTEANVASLRANNAAMEASLKSIKAQGFDVTIPDPIAAPVAAAFDPKAFSNDVNSTLVNGFNVMNRYQRLYGKALPEDLDVLAREAAQQRKSFTQHVADKYDFAGEEKRQNAAAQSAREAEVGAAAVKKYQEDNPVTQGNHELQRGVASRFPQVVRQREGVEHKQFANMSARQKIALSVAHSRAAQNSNS